MSSYLDLVAKMNKLPVHTDIHTLDIYCEYLLNDGNKVINFSNLMNLHDLVDTIDPNIFLTSDAKMARYEFLRAYLEAKLKLGIVKRKLIMRHVEDNVESRYMKIIQREIIESIPEDNLSTKDIEFINGLIYASLNTVFMHRYKIGLIKMVEDLDTAKFLHKTDDAISFMQTVLSELTTAKRRSKQENRFNLTDELLFSSVIREACDRLLSDGQFLVSGWHGLNLMLNGGFENGRVYNFIGGTGGFKSGLLLNIMKAVKLYNKGKCGKTNKRKTILFVSQENNLWETIQRIFNIFASIDNIRNFTVSEIMDMLKRGGFSVCVDDEDIDIEFRYYGNEDIGVADIKGIVEELDNDGKEVIMIIQDYIERLKPPKRNVERRVQLFDITNQLHDLAVELEIPIITASQFNKEGVSTIEDMASGNKSNVVKEVGQKNISESFGMLKNIDVNIGIVPEMNMKENRWYLGFKKFKFRGADDSKVDMFYQPFEGILSKIMLVDDVHTSQPLFRLVMGDNVSQELAEATRPKQSIKERRKLTSLVSEDELDEIQSLRDLFKDIDAEIDSIESDPFYGMLTNAKDQLVLQFSKSYIAAHPQ